MHNQWVMVKPWHCEPEGDGLECMVSTKDQLHESTAMYDKGKEAHSKEVGSNRKETRVDTVATRAEKARGGRCRGSKGTIGV